MIIAAIIAGCAGGLYVTDRLFGRSYPVGSFERVSLRCLAFVVWACFATAASLIVSAPL